MQNVQVVVEKDPDIDEPVQQGQIAEVAIRYMHIANLVCPFMCR